MLLLLLLLFSCSINAFFSLYFPSVQHSLTFEWHNLVLHGFNIFIYIVSFTILLSGQNTVHYFMKKFLLQMIVASWSHLLFSQLSFSIILEGLLVVGVIVLDGVTWSNALGIWLPVFSNIMLLKKESWSWSPMLKVNNTNISDIQSVSAATNC